MSKKFNIHDWQAKQRCLTEQARNQGTGMYIDDDEFEKEMGRVASKDNKSQETMNNADIRALQTVVGEYSLNKILHTIAVIADRIGKHDEAYMIKNLASKINDFEDLEPESKLDEGHGLDAGDVGILKTLTSQIEQGTIDSKKIKDFTRVLNFIIKSNIEQDKTKDLSKGKNEASMTGTGTSISTGGSEAYATPYAFGNNKRKKKKGYMGYKEI